MTRKTLGQVLAFGFVALLGAFLLYTGLSQSIQAKASASWPIVQGKALSTEIKTAVRTDSRTKRRTTTYQPAVAYEYQVNGVSFKGSRVAFGDISTANSSEAQRQLGEIVKSGSVEVSYNPQDPKDAVLLRANAAGSTWKIVVGIGCILFPIVPLLMRSRASRGAQPVTSA